MSQWSTCPHKSTLYRKNRIMQQGDTESSSSSSKLAPVEIYIMVNDSRSGLQNREAGGKVRLARPFPFGMYCLQRSARRGVQEIVRHCSPVLIDGKF